MATLIDDEDPSLVPFSRGAINPADVIEGEIPVPSGRMFFGSTPSGPSMEVPPGLPQVYGTASDNAYLSEQRALAGLDPRSQRQQALMKAELEEQAMRTAGQLEYQQLVQGGALPEEAYRRVAGKLNWNHPDKLALSLDRLPAPGVVPESLNSVPIMGDAGARIGDAVYGSKGQLHATRFANPNAITPEQKMGEKATQRDLDDARRALTHLQRQAEGMGGIGNKELPGQITAAQAAYDQLKKQSAGAAPKAKSSNTMIKYDKNHKGWIVDETTKKVIGPAN